MPGQGQTQATLCQWGRTQSTIPKRLWGPMGQGLSGLGHGVMGPGKGNMCPG